MDRSIEALTMHLELLGRDLETVRANSEKDGENMRALACIAEIHMFVAAGSLALK